MRVWPDLAFTKNWASYELEQRKDSDEGRRRFLARYEYPSVWETKEVYENLQGRPHVPIDRSEEILPPLDPTACPADDGEGDCHGAAPRDPDALKPRATVAHYTAVIGQELAYNLEGLARARVEKHKRLYQTDQEIHQHYIKMTSGGGEGAEDGGADEVGPGDGGATISKDKAFAPLPWGFDSAEIESILLLQNRTRLTKLAKDLIALPCIQYGDQICGTDTEDQQQKALEELRHAGYCDFTESDVSYQVELGGKQRERLEINDAEDNIESVSAVPQSLLLHGLGLPPDATFSNQIVYSKPSAFIRALITAVPPDETLTREQTLFMGKCAAA